MTLDCGGKESYGRLVCRVFLRSGEEVDLDQVKQVSPGKQYQPSLTP